MFCPLVGVFGWWFGTCNWVDCFGLMFGFLDWCVLSMRVIFGAQLVCVCLLVVWLFGGCCFCVVVLVLCVWGV